MATAQPTTKPVDAEIRDSQLLLISATNRLIDAADELKRERDRFFGLLRSRTDATKEAEEVAHV